MSWWVWLAVGALGGAGAVGRFALDAAVSARAAGEFPWGTFAVNVSGAFAIGVLAGAALPADAFALAATALVGSYTTFSTWILEGRRLGEDGELGLMGLNWGVSLGAGLGAVAIGRLVGGAL